MLGYPTGIVMHLRPKRGDHVKGEIIPGGGIATRSPGGRISHQGGITLQIL